MGKSKKKSIIKRIRIAPTPLEYNMIMKVREYIETSRTRPKKIRNDEEKLAFATGVPISYAKDAICLYKAGEIPKYDPKPTGFMTRFLDPVLIRNIREIVLQGLKSNKPVDKELILVKLEKKKIKVDRQSIVKQLLDCGFHFKKFSNNPSFHDKISNIDYRNFYLQKRLINADYRRLPKFPEVFIDEAYCYLTDKLQYNWPPCDGVAIEHSSQPILGVLSACVVFQNDKKLEARMVREGTILWKVRVDKDEAPINNNEWRHVPEEYKGLVPSSENQWNYKGHITQEMFNNMFRSLAKALSENYGSCYIHLDRAKYHTKKTNPQPSTTASLEDIKKWLVSKGIVEPVSQYHQPLNKLQLLSYIKSLNIKPTLLIEDIAKEFGHHVLMLPPYHCELQPMDHISELVRIQVKALPEKPTNLLVLRNNILEFISKIDTAKISDAWKACLRNCESYRQIFKAKSESGVAEEVDVSDFSETDYF